MEKVALVAKAIADSSASMSWQAIGVLILILLCVLFGAAGKLVDGLVKLIGFLASAFEWIEARIVGGRKRRATISRRKQFLRVLDSDLASISKAEAWNDQQFTDLEAEVEAEGGYYASPLKRLLRSKSRGLRKVPSLMKAIDESTEKCLLLMGDPGSGKSVALRHLAVQMLERASRSNREKVLVPLYVNLRELSVPPGAEVNASTIKEFVIDNVRRDDVDTADYLKSNWDEFKASGTWFFLFDSFDEIPAILHAAASESAIAEYSRAIRHFMDGIDSCRGILASREYKSPSALPWPKLRILPLNEARQEALIQNTFLSDELKLIALQKISLSRTATFQNPLFLTLLCRYVKERRASPASEHELLFGHVESLAGRDTEYVQRRWGFSGEQVLSGAAALSRLFATDSMLGLAPSLAEIQSAARRGEYEWRDEDLVKLIEALTYLKIGRTDVASVDSQNRRFAFAHRRYQESLFAMYVINNPEFIPTRQLISDERWREYLLAVLQVGRAGVADRILSAALDYLEEKSPASLVRQKRFYGQSLFVMPWNDAELNRVLLVIQEAIRFRSDIDLSKVHRVVDKIANPLWSKGDYYDRLQVLRYCNAGSPAQLSRRLEIATSTGIEALQEAAVYACRYAVDPGPRLAWWMRKYVARRVFGSTSRFECLRWEAIAAELPSTYRVDASVARAKSLFETAKSLGFLVSMLSAFDHVVTRIVQQYSHVSHSREKLLRRSRAGMTGLVFAYFVLLSVALATGILSKGITPISALMSAPLIVLAALFMQKLVQISCLDVPGRLSFRIVLQDFVSRSDHFKRRVGLMLIALAICSIPGFLVLLAARKVGVFEQSDFQVVVVGSGVALGLSLVAALLVASRSKRRLIKSARALYAASPSLHQAIAVAPTERAVYDLCCIAVERGLQPEEFRNTLSVLSALERLMQRRKLNDTPKWVTHEPFDWALSGASVLIEALENTARSEDQRSASVDKED